MAVGRISRSIIVAAALALAGAGGVVMAQKDAGGPSAGTANSFEVTGVEVDVRGKDANAARMGGWRLAQRKGWEMLSKRLTGHASDMSDSALDGLVSGIVVEQEQIGPTRYVAKLGVLFDRGRAAGILGVSGQVVRSSAMLLIPVEWSGGTGRVFERNTEWQQAWGRFHPGSSTIDYVRAQGTGPDAMLMNAAQTGRRGRGWWRSVLDQYGATDVLVAEVQLHHDYPGGPITGRFLATHGPDRTRITQFSLRVDSADGIDTLLDQAVARIDKAYQNALASGALETDKLLAMRPAGPKPEATPTAEPTDAAATPTPTPADTVASYTVQVETPSAASVTASESSVRGVPGVRSATTTSLALGGISVMRVSFDGPIESLRAMLEARGWSVQQGPGVLRIRRAGGQSTPAPAGGANGGG